MSDLLLASKTLPLASIFQGLRSYFLSKRKGRIRITFPFLQSTSTGFESWNTPMKDNPLTTVLFSRDIRSDIRLLL